MRVDTLLSYLWRISVVSCSHIKLSYLSLHLKVQINHRLRFVQRATWICGTYSGSYQLLLAKPVIAYYVTIRYETSYFKSVGVPILHQSCNLCCSSARENDQNVSYSAICVWRPRPCCWHDYSATSPNNAASQNFCRKQRAYVGKRGVESKNFCNGNSMPRILFSFSTSRVRDDNRFSSSMPFLSCYCHAALRRCFFQPRLWS